MPTPKVDFTKVKDRRLLKEINKRGYYAVKKEMRQNEEYVFPQPAGSFKVGLISDTHLGSKYQQLTFLVDFYEVCKKHGVKIVLHSGDMCDGNGKLYLDHKYEMFLHGAEEQRDYVVDNYPKIQGIKTYAISGNHDYSFYRQDGYDILKHIAQERKDIKYLGLYAAYVEMGGLEKLFYLLHGDRGGAYARSYRLQKIIESFSPENKPYILLLGHYHTPCYLPMYRNVEGFQLPCFQSQQAHFARRGRYPAIGGIILTIHQDNKGLSAIEIFWKHYYEVIKNDY